MMAAIYFGLGPTWTSLQLLCSVRIKVFLQPELAKRAIYKNILFITFSLNLTSKDPNY